VTSAARWSLAGLVLVIAAVVAIWPRDQTPPAAPPAPEIGPIREAAALEPCPSAESSAGSSAGPRSLAGVQVECLADGSAVDLASTLADSPVLVNVWAPWCQPCKQELPLLASYAAEPGAVPVVGLAIESTQASALELLDALDVRFPTVFDQNGAASRALRLPVGLPASYLVKPDGTVRLVEKPRLFHSLEEIRLAVEQA
jgi:thiol-disulfide isomerase/thioredoxin